MWLRVILCVVARHTVSLRGTLGMVGGDKKKEKCVWLRVTLCVVVGHTV